MTPPPFQRLLDGHRDAVWRFLVAAVGRDAADDVFQDTFLAALRAWPPSPPLENPRAWILTVAQRKALDHHRARARRPVVAGDLPELPAPPEAPGTRLDGELWDRVRALPPKQRAAVLLRVAGELSHAEVGVALGVSEDAARRNAFEGLRKLRLEMER